MRNAVSALLVTGFTSLLVPHWTLSAAEPPTPASLSNFADNSAAELGKRIYREGILSDGTAISAVAQQDIALSGSRIICADCHRRSAMGSSEGGNSVPAVSGSILYKPREKNLKELYGNRSAGPGARPAYTDITLGTAIREGKDPSGRTLDKLMPRYNISDKELGYLTAYIKSMDSTAAPGVTDSAIHFATVITPGVDAARKDTMLATLTAYISDLNAGTRNERRRSAFAPWPKTWHYQSYRQWRLHVWQLSGESDNWQAQLRDFYARQPVFAVINGIGEGDWRPIHDFCNETALPCVFPTTDLPVSAAEDFYTLYFSRGIAQEAETVAKHLSELKEPRPVLQIHAGTQPAIAAENATRERLLKRGYAQVRGFDLASARGNLDRLRSVVNNEKPSYLILWLDAKDIGRLAAILAESKSIERVFLSSTTLSGDIGSLPADLLENAYLLRQYSPPDKLSKNLSRAKTWAAAKNLQSSDDRVMANAYFAITTTADVVKHLRGNLIRDFFVERMEHVIDSVVFHSVYPRLSLGPGQRFASKGCYIVGPLGKGENSLLTADYEWVVP